VGERSEEPSATPGSAGERRWVPLGESTHQPGGADERPTQEPAYQMYGPPPQQSPRPLYRPETPYPPAGVRPPAPRPASPVSPPRIEPVPGTDFGLAYFTVAPTVSGPAVGSFAAGVLSIVVSLIVGCFGIAGARAGWGPVVGGAFAVLAAAAGTAAIGLGVVSMRQITRSAGRLTGRGMAVAGVSCGGVGLMFTAVAMVLALLI
jgi:hypothetical protein